MLDLRSDGTFDVVICGTGWSGFGAALKAAAQGKQVLLLESGGDLLWETTRALENSIESHGSAPQWENWVAEFRASGAANERWVEPAFLEAWAAETLRTTEKVTVLFYAALKQLEMEGGSIRQAVVVTKSGPLVIRAGLWIDATECGHLLRQCGVASRGPETHPDEALSLVCYSPEPGLLKERLREKLPQAELLPAVRSSELRVRWIAPGGVTIWSELKRMANNVRLAAGDLTLLISHASLQGFPLYAGPLQPAASPLPDNLRIAGGRNATAPLRTPFERWLAGDQVDLETKANGAGANSPFVFEAPAPEEYEREVIVAGAGTGGAMAALAAAGNGARTAVLDLSPLPGGIGTLGGINNYFHGAPGGLQTEVDEEVRDLSIVFYGERPGPKRWHPLAKALVLMERFAKSDIDFLSRALIWSSERQPDGRVTALDAVVEGRVVRVRGQAFIDSTGDGDLCAAAGAPFAIGRSGDGRTLAFTQSSQTLNEEDWQPYASNHDAGWVDATNPWDLSEARLSGLSQFVREDWSDPQRPVLIAPQIGLRQSRQVATDYAVSFSDMLENRSFSDTIGGVESVADTHSVDYEFESDELAFYYWTCRAFRHPLQCELPYRMLLPKTLENVWIACRAAGIENDASYGLRMQREMQRLGEAAGVAAALAIRGNGRSRDIPLPELQARLRATGAIRGRIEPPQESTADWLEALDEGRPGIHLWRLSRKGGGDLSAVRERLHSSNPHVSFYAAAVLAITGDSTAEERLIKAIQARETGPAETEYQVPGPNGEIIDVPFWLQAVVLLRRCGTARALPALCHLADDPALPFNARTILAATFARKAPMIHRQGQAEQEEAIINAIEQLCREPSHAMAHLPPARSLWKMLADQPQKPRDIVFSAKTEQDHTWQLHLLAARIMTTLERPIPEAWLQWRNDKRAFVRRAFASLERC